MHSKDGGGIQAILNLRMLKFCLPFEILRTQRSTQSRTASGIYDKRVPSFCCSLFIIRYSF